MRTYCLFIWENHRCVNWPGQVIYTPARIREAVISEYVSAFRQWPAFHWHQDGFMAQAFESETKLSLAKNVELEQVNHIEAVSKPNWILHNGVPHPYIGPARQLKEAA
jgi:hypothetical protein